MSNTLDVYKESTPTRSQLHCRNNTTKLKKSIPCIKCQLQGKRLKRKFNSIRSAYLHTICLHSGADSDEYPSKSDCVRQLQIISDLMNGGILK